VVCNCGKASNVQYQVRLKDNTIEFYDTVLLAQAALRRAGGGQMKAVAKTA
jgi:hypothetical protein